MFLGFCTQLPDSRVGSILKHFSQIVLSHTAQSAADALMQKARLRGTLLVLNDLLHAFYTSCDDMLRAPRQCIPQKFPPHGPGSHFEFQVAWVVNKFQDRMGRVVSLPVAELVDTRVSSGSVCIPVSQYAEDFWDKRVSEQETLRLSCRRQVTLLA